MTVSLASVASMHLTTSAGVGRDAVDGAAGRTKSYSLQETRLGMVRHQLAHSAGLVESDER